MGYKYAVNFMRNGYRPHRYERATESFIKALYWVIKLKFKYPIVTLYIRTGYVECVKCDADYCDRAGKAVL